MKRKGKRISAFLLAAVLAVTAQPFSGTAVQAEETNPAQISDTDVVTIEMDVPESWKTMDNDQLLDMYVSRMLGIADVQKARANFGALALNEDEQKIYNELRKEIENIAANGGSSENLLGDNDAGKITWTYEELSLSAEADRDAVQAVVNGKIDEELWPSLQKIVSVLLVDCPYELYWFNKTSGGGWITHYSYSYDGSVVDLSVTFDFAVAAAYQKDGNAYTVDGSKAGAAKTAVANADAIIQKYQDKSDLEKLEGYKDEICSLTAYNNEAADDESTPYGDPWQIIYVFDQDKSTNVVCEGYAKAFQYLCDRTVFSSGAVVCYTVTGIMAGGTGAGGHMWNIVTMPDGKNYLVDVTNCDAGTIGYSDKLFLVGTQGSIGRGYTFNIPGSITYTYDSETTSLYGTGDDSILKLASGKFDSSNVLMVEAPSATVDYGTKVTLNVTGSAGNVEVWGDSKLAEGTLVTGTKTEIEIDTYEKGLVPDETGADKEYALTVVYADGSQQTSVTLKVGYANDNTIGTTTVQPNGAGWYNKVFDINPPAGYRIAAAAGKDTTWSDTALSLGSGEGEVAGTYFLRKMETGAISKVDYSYKVDLTAPTNLKTEVSEEAETSAVVTVSASDSGSGVNSYGLQYASGGSAAPTIQETTSGSGVFRISGMSRSTTYTFKASALDAADNRAETTVSVTTKGKENLADAEVTISGEYTYNSSPITPSTSAVTVKLDGTTVSADEYNVTFSDNVNAGTAKVTVTAKEGSENYTGSAEGSFTIGKAAVTITAQDQTVTYGTAITGGTDKVNLGSGLQGEDVLESITLTPSTDQATTSGTITPSAAVVKNSKDEDVTENYNITYTPGKLLIEKAKTSISLTNWKPSKDYDGQPLSVPGAGDIQLTGAAYSDVTFTWYKDSVAEANKLNEAPSDAGTYVLTAVVQGTNNTEGSSASATVEIRTKQIPKENITITLPEEGYTYDGSAKTPQITVWIDKEKQTMVPAEEYTVVYKDNTNAGTATVKVSGVAEKNNYQIEEETFTFPINKADPDVGNVSCTGDLYTSMVPGNVNLTMTGETPGEIKLDAEALRAGTYTYTWIFTPTDTTNYYTATGTIELTVQVVEPEKISVSGSLVKTSYVYGDTLDPAGLTVTVSYTDGNTRNLTADEYTIKYKKGSFLHVGDTAVTVSYTEGGKTMEAEVTGLTTEAKEIENPDIRLSIPSEGYTYDGSAKEPAVSVYDGTTLISSEEYSVSYSNNTEAGNATVTVADKTGGNYIVNGSTIFEIKKAGQAVLTITGMPTGEIVYGDEFTLSTTGGSGSGAVVWSVESGDCVSVDKNGKVTVTGTGEAVIQAVKEGDNNHLDGKAAQWKLTVGKANPNVGEVSYNGGVIYSTTDPTSVTLEKSGSIEGTLRLAEGTEFTVGTAEYGWVFTPTDTEHYNTISGTIRLTVEADLPQKLEVTGTPDRLQYVFGETFDPSGLSAQLTYKSGRVESVDLAKLTVEYENGAFLQAGDTGVSLSYGYDGGSVSCPLDFEIMGIAVSAKQVSEPIIVLDKDEYTYTGTAIYPQITVMDGDTVIPAEEYTVTYADNVNAGTGTITITDADGGNYEIAERTVSFRIVETQQENPKPGESDGGTQNEKPEKDSESAVQTGDTSKVAGMFFLTLLSGMAVLGTLVCRRKR